ncbi:hypothetical protein TDB9533_02311 [Thalassocella blandensis]|nr:hypothetical protein TDB9533_02311 [Thalassocella blandensis]
MTLSLIALISFMSAIVLISRQKLTAPDIFVWPWLIVLIGMWLIEDHLLVIDTISVFFVAINVFFIFVLLSLTAPALEYKLHNIELRMPFWIDKLVIFVVACMAFQVLLTLLDAFNYSGGLVGYTLKARFALMHGEDRPGKLANPLYYKIYKNALLFLYVFGVFFLVTSRRKLAVICCLSVMLGYLIMGERWSPIYTLLTFGIYFFTNSHRKKLAFLMVGVLFAVLFIGGSLLRDRADVKDIGRDLIVYSIGGLVAYGAMSSESCSNCYTPPTFRYIGSILGVSDKSTDVVGAPVNITKEGGWTNTYAIWGSLHFYFGRFGTVIIVWLSVILIYVLSLKMKNSRLAAYYFYMFAPALVLSIFAEALFQLAPTIIRSTIILPFLLFVKKGRRYV